MNPPRREFRPLQVQEIARAFLDAGVEYLFIGKSDAILLGYPGTTQDADVFPARSESNRRRIAAALRKIEQSLATDLIAFAKPLCQVLSLDPPTAVTGPRESGPELPDGGSNRRTLIALWS